MRTRPPATVIDLYNGPVNDSFALCGSASIGVEAGYGFGIIVGGSNFDTTSLLGGTVRISNLAGLCATDVNGDGDVGINDLLALLGAWGPCP